ncbi:transketolase family protein [Christensenellaceae bacterium OttesenSCG-928-L17]|nr:transketolase family protein [Christensenellaceae bacterium OttesenSCG-928-L17]
MKIVYNGSMDTVLFKDILGTTIPKLLDENPDIIYLDADLMSCIGTTKYAAAHPERAINCGIAEANMIGVAAGLSAAGYKPIAHSFGIFSSRRVFDQVFLSAGYANNPMTILGTDPGVTAAYNGGTHMPFEDVALYRTIPNATIIDITDSAMLQDILLKISDYPGVKYIRVGRKAAAKVYETGSSFEIGKGIPLRSGKDAVIFACGIMVHEALQAAKELAEEGIDVAVVDLFTIKPLDTELVARLAKNTGAVVVAENHNRIGGLYSAVCDALAATCPTPVEWVAVDDSFGEVGPQNYLQERFGLTSAQIVKKTKRVLERKVQ